MACWSRTSEVTVSPSILVKLPIMTQARANFCAACRRGRLLACAAAAVFALGCFAAHAFAFQPAGRPRGVKGSNKLLVGGSRAAMPRSTTSGWAASSQLLGRETLATPRAASKVLYIVSDASGQTATALANRLLVQYADVPVPETRIFGYIHEDTQLSDIVFDASQDKENSMIFATLVDARLANLLKILAIDKGVPIVDVMTPLLTEFTQFLDKPALGVPGGVRTPATVESKRKVNKKIDDQFFGMVEAMQFRQRHISGLNRHGWPDADVLLVGCSRVGKTAVSLLLAQRGLKVANLNLSPDDPLPKELSTMDPEKVFVLYINPNMLAKLRHNRLLELQQRRFPNFLSESYADPRRIQSEVSFVLRLASEHPEWGESLDMSYMGPDEGASVIVRLLQTRKSR